MNTAVSTVTFTADEQGNHEDAEYEAYLARVRNRFLANTQHGAIPVFTTDVENLYQIYLGAFPESQRQFHNCNACKHFIQNFGGLVTIDEQGNLSPAMWATVDTYDCYGDPVAAMIKAIKNAKVTGPFLSADRVWGHPKTGKWVHLHAINPKIYKGTLYSAYQEMAEKRQDFQLVLRALDSYKPQVVAEALRVLEADAVNRAEKFLGPVRWLADLHKAFGAAGRKGRNAVWLAVATAPSGFAHVKTGMVGTLLDDIAAGKDFEDVRRAFNAKMHPLQYQRPQAAPAAGTVVQAEKAFAALGLGPSLERRFARVEEIHALWYPNLSAQVTAEAGQLFAHLKVKAQAPAVQAMTLPSKKMTWAKFEREVLPGAAKIEFQVPRRGQFTGIVTAVHADAPPILSWDLEDRRNPFSQYVYHGGSAPHEWNLHGQYAEVTAITLQPAQWYEASERHGNGLVLILKGARDLREPTLCLFPETLRRELHEFRSVVEAFSKSAKMQGSEEATACGIALRGEDWNCHLRVTTGEGIREIHLDRWD